MKSDKGDPQAVPAIESRILTLRGLKVILDSDLAAIYGVTTKALNQAVKRNASRFPADFLFPLTSAEKAEVVTVCDHLQLLGRRELKEKVHRKSSWVAFDCLVQGFRGHTVEAGEIPVEHHLLAAHSENDGFDAGGRLELGSCLHVRLGKVRSRSMD